MHQAKLAILPNKEDVQFVAGIIHQSGQLEAVVGLKKVKPLSKKLRHLYRYLWQWGERGSPVAYDQLQIQRDGPLLDCAVLDVRPPAQFRPLPCVLPRNVPDGEDENIPMENVTCPGFYRCHGYALSLTGNAGVLIYRLLSQGQKSSGAFTVLVSNLCASDLLMGVYMMMIGSADEYYRGVYVSKEAEWRGSAVCKVAGFLAFLSSEVSAFVICLVTLDRFVVLCFPLKKNVHMNVRSALTACAIAWGVGVMLAAVPLIAQWEFYGQNGICLPLPITRREFPGKEYAYGVFIVLNFVLFLFIGVGQALIFRSIRRAGSQAGTKRRQQEADIARRLFLVVLTDFLCWFPIGLMGLLAYRGTPIAGVVNVWAAIFVLPLNSAINPFVYALNSMVQRWQQQRLEKRTKRALGRLQAEIPKWSNASIEELMRICLRTKAVKKERILQWLGFRENVERDLSDRVETAERDQELEQEGPDENRSFDGASARTEPPTDDNLFTVCSTFKTG
nr:hypothetical protein BaRGS_002210 [Batillaria attramentaria]